MKRSLGILAKKGYRDDSCSLTIQQEYKEPSRRSYHPWFDSLMSDMAKCHNYSHSPFTALEREEAQIVNPMSRVATNISRIFNKTFSAVTASKVTNT